MLYNSQAEASPDVRSPQLQIDLPAGSRDNSPLQSDTSPSQGFPANQQRFPANRHTYSGWSPVGPPSVGGKKE